MMPNRPEYLAIWLGITSVGGVVSLLNTQLRGPSLAHCIDIVAPRHVIVAAELIDAFRSATLSCQPKVWSHGSDDFARIDREIEQFSGAPLGAAESRDVTIADRALTIYTSGTTGLPKAANVSHHRLMQWSLWFAGLMNAGPDDRMYDCLPMYHSVGGVVATGGLAGQRRFGRDRREILGAAFLGRHRQMGLHAVPIYRRTVPLSRQRAAASARARASAAACAGNGLRADVWEKFQSRFEIPKILEFYAATEGNVSLYNVEGKVGAIGRVPPFLKHRFPLALVKFDDAKGAPARDDSGRCIRCATGEMGEAIGKIRGSVADRRRTSRAIPAPRIPSAKSCATCSSRATPGIAPAI